MKLEQLNYLLALSKYQSINLTAEKLHISQQALSASMKNLEEEFGATILTRSFKGVNLTEDGKKVLRFAKKMLLEYDALCQELRQDTGTPPPLRGQLDLIASPAIATILADSIASFGQRHNEVKIQLLETDDQEIPQLLKECHDTEQRHYIAISNRLDSRPFDAAIEVCPMLQERMIACVSKASPLAKQKQVSMKVLLKQPIVHYLNNQGEDNLICMLLNRYGTPHYALTTSNQNVLFEAIGNHVGVTLIPEKMLQTKVISPYMDHLAFIPLVEQVTTVYCYMLRPDQKQQPIVAQFIQEVLSDQT